MEFRNFTLAALLVGFLTVGNSVPRLMAQTGPPATSSAASSTKPMQAAQARFFTRIREMLAEARALEAAGKPGEAMLIAVRASRMLEVIGGESVWPRVRKEAVSSPADYLAVLAERYDPDVLNSARATLPLPKKTSAKKPEGRSTSRPAPPVAVAGNSSAKPTNRSQPGSDIKPSNPFDRFPELPSKSRSWVPVGDAVAPADDWKPVGGAKIKPSASAGPPVSPTPIPVFEEPDRGQHFGEKSEGGGVTDHQVGPIPVNLVSPSRPDSNAIDIRAEEEASGDEPAKELPGLVASPQKLPGDVQSVPVPMEVSGKPASQDSSSNAGPELPSPATADSGESLSTVTPDSSAASSGIWFATLVGACGGVLLMLTGGFLVRRFAATSSERVATEPIEKQSGLPETEHTVEGMTEAMIAASVLPDETPAETSFSAWVPGASWDGSAVSEPNDVASATDAEQTVVAQLQVYRGDAASAEAGGPVAASADDIATEVEAPDARNSESYVEPVVPFRVIGTDVVLGEAESARVDDELQQRREKILQRVLDENSDMQRRLDEQGEQPREAA